MRKLATAIPEAVSRLNRAGFLPAPPTWYLPVLTNPPPVQPPRSTVRRSPAFIAPGPSSSSSSSPPPTARSWTDLPRQRIDAAQEGTTRTHKMKHLRERKPRAQAIVYEEDRVRRQFFADFPFEALRPVSLVEGRDVRGMGEGEAEVDGPQWERLEQRGAYPTVENTIAYAMNLHRVFDLPLTKAYAEATSQFTKLRAQHEMSTLAAEAEARSHGADFKAGPFERVHQKERATLDTLASQYTTSTVTSPSNKYKKAARWSMTGPAAASASASHFSEDFSGGQKYMGKWTLVAPASNEIDGADVQAGAEAEGPEAGRSEQQIEQEEEAMSDEAIMREYLAPLRP